MKVSNPDIALLHSVNGLATTKKIEGFSPYFYLLFFIICRIFFDDGPKFAQAKKQKCKPSVAAEIMNKTKKINV